MQGIRIIQVWDFICKFAIDFSSARNLRGERSEERGERIVLSAQNLRPQTSDLRPLKSKKIV